MLIQYIAFSHDGKFRLESGEIDGTQRDVQNYLQKKYDPCNITKKFSVINNCNFYFIEGLSTGVSE